jgi:hypothetical protein
VTSRAVAVTWFADCIITNAHEYCPAAYAAIEASSTWYADSREVLTCVAWTLRKRRAARSRATAPSARAWRSARLHPDER